MKIFTKEPIDVYDIELLWETVEEWHNKYNKKQYANFGPKYCPLCLRYKRYDCHNCPIYVHTEERFCKGTPYENARLSCINIIDFGNSSRSKKEEYELYRNFNFYVKLEIEFLVELLFAYIAKYQNEV